MADDAAAVDATATEDDKEEEVTAAPVEMIEVVFKTGKFGLKTFKVGAFELLKSLMMIYTRSATRK